MVSFGSEEVRLLTEALKMTFVFELPSLKTMSEIVLGVIVGFCIVT
jgi:hypothetical protein